LPIPSAETSISVPMQASGISQQLLALTPPSNRPVSESASSGISLAHADPALVYSVWDDLWFRNIWQVG
jgi:hypothetical protein